MDKAIRRFGINGVVAWLSIVFAAFALAAFSPSVLTDGDTYWHIATGRWMIDNWTVLRIDPFSFTFAGHPWQTHEWLSEIALALAYVGGGWSGVLLLVGAAFALTIGLIARTLSRSLSGLGLITTLVLVVACLTGSLLARPHLLALPILAVWTGELIGARDQGRRPSWWLLPLVIMWANLHASFLFGLCLLLPLGLEAVLENPGHRMREAKAWGGFLAASLACALLTPFGLDGVIFPFTLLGMDQLYTIVEWRPSPLGGLQPWMLALGAALFVLLSRGTKIKPLRLLVLLGLAYMALSHARHQMLLAVCGSLFLAAPLADAFGSAPPSPFLRRRSQIGAAAFFLALAGLRLAIAQERTDGPATPMTALAQVPAALRTAPVFNDYSFGGYLIFNDIRPFIDGRTELYGDDFLARYARATHPDPAVLAKLLADYRIRWTILPPANPAATAMDALPGWRRLHADRFAVIHIKEPS